MDDSQQKVSTSRPVSEVDVQTIVPVESGSSGGKGRAFWMSFLAILVSTFLSAMDLTAIGTVLPTITASLNDTKGDFSWVHFLDSNSTDPDQRLILILGWFRVCVV